MYRSQDRIKQFLPLWELSSLLGGQGCLWRRVGCSSARTTLSVWSDSGFPLCCSGLGSHGRRARPHPALPRHPAWPRPSSCKSRSSKLHSSFCEQGLMPQVSLIWGLPLGWPGLCSWGMCLSPHLGGHQSFSCTVSLGWASSIRVNTHCGI